MRNNKQLGVDGHPWFCEGLQKWHYSKGRLTSTGRHSGPRQGATSAEKRNCQCMTEDGPRGLGYHWVHEALNAPIQLQSSLLGGASLCPGKIQDMET